MTEKLLVLTDDNFETEVLLSEIPVVVDFWAPWCGPCRALGPIIERLATEFSPQMNIAKLNVDDCPKTAAKYGIQSIPSVLFFQGGKIVNTMVGVQAYEDYVQALNSALQSRSTV